MQTAAKTRIASLDILRGLVMVIMALDHTRDFFHFDAFLHDPLDPATTTPALFFTRWITHFCAPLFVFLAGTSAWLQGLRKSKVVLQSFLIRRGLWLIVVECVIITFAWTFDPGFHVIILQVIWAIGISMVFLGLLLRLPYRILLFLGVLLVAGHNTLDYFPSTHHGAWWDLARNGNFATLPLFGQRLIVIYPFLPWLGLMILGYCFGKLYTPGFQVQRRRILLLTGAGLILFFVFLRWTNAYGNPTPWSVQAGPLYTLLSFLNTHKYPPSLLFLCMTVGPALIFLAVFENADNRLTRAISVFGRVPFFYYVLHFYLLHTLCMILFLARGHAFSEATPGVYGIPFRFLISGEGYPLRVVYVIWMAVVLALYPLCLWYGGLKRRKKWWWLSYL
jgi:uncharacterized membrane protein